MTRLNEYGQPIGNDLGTWEPPGLIPQTSLTGNHVRLVPLEPSHARAMYPALRGAEELWTYMPFGPFASAEALEAEFRRFVARADWRPYAVEIGGELEGFLTYMRIQPEDGALEIGSIVYAPRMQRTTAATETIYLLLRHAFESGYRRVEWKCDDLNAPSRRAAVRLGFRYEGTFRMATHYKGRSRDTAWYAVTVNRWPELERAFEAWLTPDNFDTVGHQLTSLSDLTS